MSQGSLRLRLLAAGAASIVVALALAGAGLLMLFERHVERRMVAELNSYLNQVVSELTRDEDGSLDVGAPPAEPLFQQPLSGLYWQVSEEETDTVLRSRSLWDSTLELPPDSPSAFEVHEHELTGPDGASLLAVERRINLPPSLGNGAVRAVVAVDRQEIHAAGRAFAADLFPSLVLLAAVLIIAAWIQVSIGLRPLDTVRQRLAQIRSGEATRLGSVFPDEVLPLAAEVDHLLDEQERAIARARTRAADLAHGLKTPLTVLAADAKELRARGEFKLAGEIECITASMRRHLERELVRARTGVRALAAPVQPIRPVVDRVISVLQRSPRGRNLSWQVEVSDGLGVRVDEHDLLEILGNLAENAAKWAANTVRITGKQQGNTVILQVEDDGPGVPENQTSTVLARGGRLDESSPGSGLGLAIVNDLLEAHGGTISLHRSQLGGLLAEVRLPMPPGDPRKH